ncbi:carbohydrate-binding family 9-like protein [Algibacter pectinivorans]|uniref:Carbohydrate family 9 binding domain-like n=1 Tax=Algibacter pectinivorans TaxID=870482 RepID=A0A1I1PRS1_9FLAO|nr:carbohydrate-binding family 9-like protein [Algibacter pectinivorans]SFD12614.1 Carbohydrate family 9 binding domain-like [Algibacter pectinivorans]
MRLIAVSNTLFIRGLYFISLFFLCLPFSSYAQNTVNYSTPKSYIANHTNEIIKIDGLGLEESWKNAEYSDVFIDIEGVKKPKYNTQVKILWDKNYIYFLATMEEPHVWGTLRKRDTIIFHNNDFEIFVDPDGDAHNYYEFEFNALNTVWDLFITKPYRDGALTINDWDANGLKSAVYVDGTLNNPNDIDKSWSIEIAIPLKVFKTSYFQTIDLNDKFWRINFSRVNWDFQLDNKQYSRKKDKNGAFSHEYNWVWSPQGVIAMHQPETWGYVYFANEDVKEINEFLIPKDEHIKWFLFDLHNQLKKKKITAKDVSTAKFVLEKKLVPKYQSHETGYNIWIDSPFTGSKIILNQNGQIIIK